MWKDIQGYEGVYQVDENGNVYSIRKKKILKAMDDLIKREDAIEAIEFGITYAKMIDSDGWTKPLFENENRELKKAIERIKDIPSSEPTVDKDYLIELIQGAVYDGEDCARLMKMVEPKQGEWIPCSESLPKRQGYYICTCKDGSKYKRTTVVKWSNGWQLTGARAYWVVLAWMPLPEPWKGADDEID